jgi:hypothetical protein
MPTRLTAATAVTTTVSPRQVHACGINGQEANKEYAIAIQSIKILWFSPTRKCHVCAAKKLHRLLLPLSKICIAPSSGRIPPTNHQRGCQVMFMRLNILRVLIVSSRQTPVADDSDPSIFNKVPCHPQQHAMLYGI